MKYHLWQPTWIITLLLTGGFLTVTLPLCVRSCRELAYQFAHQWGQFEIALRNGAVFLY